MNRYALVLLLLLATGSVHAGVSDITSTSATVTATSESEVTFTLHAGSSIDDLNMPVGGGTGVSTSMTLGGLSPATTYYYTVERCADSCINDTIDSFTTLAEHNVWLEAIMQDGIVTLHAESDAEAVFTFHMGTDYENLDTTIDGGQGTESWVDLPELVEGVRYYIVVDACNPSCAYATIDFALPPPDVAAAASDVTNQSALVSLDSTQPAVFLLLYGIDPQPEVVADVADTLREGETKTYTINDVDYEVTLVFVSDLGSDPAEAKFSVNGELTPPLREGEKTSLVGGMQIGIRDTLVNAREGVVSFFFAESFPTWFVEIEGESTSTAVGLDALSPETTYYYQAIGCSQDWCSTTDVMTFTTLVTVIDIPNSTNTTTNTTTNSTTNSTNTTGTETPRPRRSGGGGGGGVYIPPKTNVTANSTNTTAANTTNSTMDATQSAAQSMQKVPVGDVRDAVPEPETPVGLAPAMPEESVLTTADEGLTGMVVADDAPAQESPVVLWLRSVFGTIAGWFS